MELYQWLIWPINFNEISQVRKAARIWPSDEILIAFSKSNMALAAAQPGHLDKARVQVWGCSGCAAWGDGQTRGLFPFFPIIFPRKLEESWKIKPIN